MEFFQNPGKSVEVTLPSGEKYVRHAIKTHFVKIGEDYISLVRQYVSDIYQPGDILSVSEKIIALCQKRVIYKKDLKIGFLAKFLSKFVHVTPAGPSVGDPYKMQSAILICGAWKVLFAAICAGIGKIFGKKGIFYEITGPEVSGLDGFYDLSYKEYGDYGIRIPENPDGVCDEIYEKTGVLTMVVDANDLGVEILGKSSKLELSKEELAALIRDNPAGQEAQQTPFILIRRAADPQPEEELSAQPQLEVQPEPEEAPQADESGEAAPSETPPAEPAAN